MRDAKGRYIQKELPNREIAEFYLTGTSINKLAKAYAVSRTAITQRLEAMKINTRTQSESEFLKWQQMTPEQREKQVQAAHNINLGRKHSLSERKQAAVTRQFTHILSDNEIKFKQLFAEFDLFPVTEFPLGIYNLDFAFPVSKLAIEVDGGNWHASELKSRYDTGKEVLLSKQGWRIIRVKINRGAITITTKGEGADLIKILNVICSDPTLWRENGMVSS